MLYMEEWELGMPRGISNRIHMPAAGGRQHKEHSSHSTQSTLILDRVRQLSPSQPSRAREIELSRLVAPLCSSLV